MSGEGTNPPARRAVVIVAPAPSVRPIRRLPIVISGSGDLFAAPGTVSLAGVNRERGGA
jgi:hypothetical protein